MKKRTNRILLVLGAALFVVLALVLVPPPMEGRWYGRLTRHGCYDPAFLRFTGGTVRYYHGEDPPEDWGTYERQRPGKCLWIPSTNAIPVKFLSKRKIVIDVGWRTARSDTVIESMGAVEFTRMLPLINR